MNTNFEEYEDFELAALIHFKASTYLPETKEKIYQEAYRRGLTKNDLIELRKGSVPTGNKTLESALCPRCGSTKIVSSKEMISNRTEGINSLLEKEPQYKKLRRCAICDWDFEANFSKKEKKSIFVWILIVLLFTFLFTTLYIMT